MEFLLKEKSVNLDKILAYSNQDVIYRFLKLYNVSRDEAEDLFIQTKKWIFACALNDELFRQKEIDFYLVINDDLLILDAMWHNFILFTKDYRDFCQKYIGIFIDHTPMRKSEELNDQNQYNTEDYATELRNMYRKQYSFIHDLFGKDTLIKWHKDWPEKYSINEIKKLQK